MVTMRSSVSDETGQHVERGGLAAARAAGDEDVLPPQHARLAERGGVERQRAALHQVVDGEGNARELADRQRRPR